MFCFQLWDITVGMNYLHTMDPSIGHYCLCPRVVQVSNLLLYYSILSCVYRYMKQLQDCEPGLDIT